MASNPNKPRLKVIGAGLGRTGTASLQTALQQLGYKTYHMIEALQNPAHLTMWANVAKGRVPISEAAKMLLEEGYRATVDYTTADYVEDF